MNNYNDLFYEQTNIITTLKFKLINMQEIKSIIKNLNNSNALSGDKIPIN